VTLLGTVALHIGTPAGNGTVSYTDLQINAAVLKQLTSSDEDDLTHAPRSTLTQTATPPTKLAFTTQPGNATAGSAFGTQPVIEKIGRAACRERVELAAGDVVTVKQTTGSGTLLGTVALNIGHEAGNGTVSSTGLKVDCAGVQ